jgi:ABC-type cobalamin/Fe3+-siderophores transport system ATPase subunit
VSVQIVLISGKQGSGKTTLAKKIAHDIMNMEKGTRAVLMNFADPLREMHDFCLGVLASGGIVRDIQKDGELMQLLGTEWGRKIDPDIWVKVFRGRLKSNIDRLGNLFEKYVIIIGDCRFPNEFEMMPEALRVRLECPREIRKERAEYWRQNEMHPSEIALDDHVFAGKFDMMFDTQTQSVEHCASMIGAQLFKQSWIEKRK